MLSVLTLAMLAVIEIRHPYFFLQDDNRALYFPFFVHNFRALLGGEFSFYNFHQYLGMPVSSQYAAFYPINYFALYLSNLIFGNYFASMELIAVFHLIVAALGFFSLMRSFELEEVSCFFGAIAWTFCGFVITMGNSWIQTLGFAAYLPWILLFSIKQIYRFDIKCFLILVMFKVLDMLLGYPQLFVYTMTFEFMTVTMLFFVNKQSGCGPACAVNAKDASPSPSFIKLMFSLFVGYAFVFIISLPLILQTLQQASVSAGRKNTLPWNDYAAFSYNLKYWLNGLLAPFRAVEITTQFELHSISHIGYLTLVCIVIAVAGIKNKLARKRILVFGGLALLSLLWAGDIIVTNILYHMPVYNKLRYPFKVAFFTSFYLVMISAFGFDLFYEKIRSLKGFSRNSVAVIVLMIMTLHAGNLLIFHTTQLQSMFSRHEDKVPFDEPLKELLTDGRIISASLDDVYDGEKIVPGYSAPLLAFDYATLWGLFHFGGYDPMVPEKAQVAALGMKNNPIFNLPADEPFMVPADTLEHFRKWGVKWYVVNKAIPLSDDGIFKLYYSDQHRNVLMDTLAKPFVYWRDNPGDTGSIKYKFKTNAIEISYVGTAGGPVIINVVQHPYFSAQLDGKEVPIIETGDKQVSVSAPAGRHRIVLKYTDKFFIYSSLISAAFIILLIPCMMSSRVRAGITKYMS